MSTDKTAEIEEKVLLELRYQNEVILRDLVSTSQLKKKSEFFEKLFVGNPLSRLKECLEGSPQGESSLKRYCVDVQTSHEGSLRALLRHLEGHSCVINREQFADVLKQAHAWSLPDVERQIADYLRKRIAPALKQKFNRHEPDSIEHLHAITKVASTLEEGSCCSIGGPWNEHVFSLKDECSKWIVVAFAEMYDRQPFMLPTELREDIPHACCPDHVMDTEVSGSCPKCRNLRLKILFGRDKPQSGKKQTGFFTFHELVLYGGMGFLCGLLSSQMARFRQK